MPAGFSYLAIYVAGWIVICLLWWVFKGEKYGITGPPFYLIYRTSRLNNWIERISAWKPTFWRTVWNLGIVVGVGSMVFAFYYFLQNLLNLFFKTPKAAPVQILVPVPGLGVSFETFPYLALALSVLLISHELSHGVASLAERIPLKSAGAFFGHVLMGGFVEPDEEKLNQARSTTKLRVFAAGSFTNVILGIVFILLLANFSATIAPFYNVLGSGVTIGSVPTNLPAHASGIQAGEIVTGINGTKVSSITDLQHFMAPVTPGEVIALQTNNGTFIVRTTADPSNSSHALIGIGGLTDLIIYQPKFPFLSSSLPMSLARAEYWLSGLLVSVAVINMLPIPVLDGDKFLETALKLLGVKRTKELRIVVSSAAVAILVLNIGLSWLRFGFLRY
jgi:membrane-associated protease RseP (regulator of RpoE activity)